MAKIKIAINGFGRIGRQTFRAALFDKKIQVVAINDLTDTATLAHLLKYDTAYGVFEMGIGAEKEYLLADGKKFPVYAEKDPALLPWKKLKVDVVLECTGRFTDRAGAEKHLSAGAKKVIISAPPKEDDIPIYVRGVNCNDVKREKSLIISNASCTTNCIAPIMWVLSKNFGVEKALMSTIHGYTADQNLQDGPHKDWRRARAAAENIVPTTTGAAKSVGVTLAEMKGIFDGLAFRVPVPTVSLADITAILKKNVNKEEINQALRAAAKNSRFSGIVDVNDEPLVSSDFIGNAFSSVVDLSLTNVVGGNMVKVVSWYDNECGYAKRLLEMAEIFGA